MAPELATKKDYNGKPADIWALGVILFIMLSGKFPFFGEFEEDLYRRIALGKYKIPDEISQSAGKLIKKMLSSSGKSRIDIEKVLSDDWIN